MSNNKVMAAFRLNGGIGTYLAELNFIQFFYDAFPEHLSITVFGANSETANDGLMKSQYFIDQYFIRSKFSKEGYDIVVDINWFPNVLSVNAPKIAAISPELLDLLKLWTDFKTKTATKNFVREDSLYDFNIYTFAIANQKNRLDVMDIGGALGIEKNYRYNLPLTENQNDVLKRFNLYGAKYITIQQGVNSANLTTQLSPKQWSPSNFTTLCHMLKKEYPAIVLVQLGEKDNNVNIQGVDRCLLGCTDFEELKVLLNNAYLHIDGECGMVHMRRALQAGPSVVLFGQTPKKVYSYPDDINIHTDICQGCNKLFDAWKRRCFLGSEPICITSITPEMVFNAVDNYIKTSHISTTVTETKLQKLLNDPNINLDMEWVDRWLRHRVVYDYWLEKIKIKNIFARKVTEYGTIRVALEEMPAYRFLSGDRKAYTDYMELLDSLIPYHEHSLQGFEGLITQFENDGFQQNSYIVINGKNAILDGVHRASWLLHQYGDEYEVDVLKMYGDWEI